MKDTNTTNWKNKIYRVYSHTFSFFPIFYSYTLRNIIVKLSNWPDNTRIRTNALIYIMAASYNSHLRCRLTLMELLRYDMHLQYLEAIALWEFRKKACFVSRVKHGTQLPEKRLDCRKHVRHERQRLVRAESKNESSQSVVSTSAVFRCGNIILSYLCVPFNRRVHRYGGSKTGEVERSLKTRLLSSLIKPAEPRQ